MPHAPGRRACAETQDRSPRFRKGSVAVLASKGWKSMGVLFGWVGLKIGWAPIPGLEGVYIPVTKGHLVFPKGHLGWKYKFPRFMPVPGLQSGFQATSERVFRPLFGERMWYER